MVIDINSGHPDIEGLRFCKKIMLKYSPLERRPHLNHLCIKGGRAYSTDGCRLHSAELQGSYADGLYVVTVCRAGFVQIAKSQYGTSVFPPTEDVLDMNGYIRLGSHQFCMSDRLWVDAVFEIMRYGVKINPDFVSDLAGYFDAYVIDDANKFEHKPVIFINSTKRCAIMPMH